MNIKQEQFKTDDGHQFNPTSMLGQLCFFVIKDYKSSQWEISPLIIDKTLVSVVKERKAKVFMSRHKAEDFISLNNPFYTKEEFLNEYRRGWNQCAMIIPYWIEQSKECSTREEILKMLKTQIQDFTQGNYTLEPEPTVKTFVNKLNQNNQK